MSVVPCGMFVGINRTCDRPSTATLHFACRHEHVDTHHFCEVHAAQAHADLGFTYCQECDGEDLGADRHHCPILGIKEVALA